MRLHRLDLTRYGRFTDHGLDFGPAPPDGPDLHIVYGPNEAGKSTLLNAWLDLVYGIEERSRYDFLHPKPALRVAARIEIAGRVHEIARIKRRTATLIGPDGDALEEGLLAGALSGVGREAYRAMFSLDDATIESGGEAILESRGELGEMLFAASAGTAALGARLRAMAEEADAFHRPKAKKSELARLKAELAEIAAERRALDVSAPEQARLVAARKAAVEAEAAEHTARAEAEARLETARRRLAALGPRDRLARLRAERDALPDHPAAPARWAGDLPRLMRAETAVQTRRAELEARRARIEAALATIPEDPAILDCADRLDALATAPGGGSSPEARFATAEEDLPARRAERAALRRDCAALAARLGAPGDAAPETLLLPGPTVARLRALIERRSGLEAAAAAARHEAAEAEAVHARAAAAAADPAAPAPPPPGAVEALAAARAAAQGGGHDSRSAAAAERVARLDSRLAAQLAALAPWSGPAEALPALAPPGPARRAAWRTALDAALREVERAAAARAEADAGLAAAEARRAAAAGTAAEISDAAAAAARAARDGAWAEHRTALDAASADRFAAAMAEDDRLGAARLARAGDLARLRAAEAECVIARQARDAAEARHAAARRSHAAQVDEIAAAIAAMARPGVPAPPVADPAALEDWLAARESAMATLAERDAAARERAEAGAAAAALRRRLCAALAALDAPDGGDRGDGAAAPPPGRAAPAGRADTATGGTDGQAAPPAGPQDGEAATDAHAAMTNRTDPSRTAPDLRAQDAPGHDRRQARPEPAPHPGRGARHGSRPATAVGDAPGRADGAATPPPPADAAAAIPTGAPPARGQPADGPPPAVRQGPAPPGPTRLGAGEDPAHGGPGDAGPEPADLAERGGVPPAGRGGPGHGATEETRAAGGGAGEPAAPAGPAGAAPEEAQAPPALDTLLAAADAALAAAEAAAADAEARRAALARAEETAAARRRNAAAAERALADWRAEHASALCGTWLAGSVAASGSEALGAVLDDLSQLDARLSRIRDLEDRIAKMERDRADYLDRLGAIAADLGLAPAETGMQATALARRLADRLARARADAARRAEKIEDHAQTAEAAGTLEAEAARQAAEAHEMTAHFSVATLGEVETCLAALARRGELDRRIAEDRAALADAVGMADAATAEAAVEALDRADLEAERHAAEADLARIDAALGERVAARVRAEDAVAAIGSDDRAARLEQRAATCLARIAAGARRHLAQRLGLAATARALALYRERNRSAMLEDAARAFRLITAGAYAGLAAQPAADGHEQLVALVAGGGSRLAAELSKGTRFQLYLALRLAGHRAFARHREPLPFVADDIMETFDDARAGAALALMAEMAKTGQVICLTHHRHLCEIAREVCPGAVFHSLPEAGPAPARADAHPDRPGG